MIIWWLITQLFFKGIQLNTFQFSSGQIQFIAILRMCITTPMLLIIVISIGVLHTFFFFFFCCSKHSPIEEFKTQPMHWTGITLSATKTQSIRVYVMAYVWKAKWEFIQCFFISKNRFSDIKKYFWISKNRFSDIKKYFFISKNRFFYIKESIFWYQKLIFWYQKIFSDIKKLFLI